VICEVTTRSADLYIIGLNRVVSAIASAQWRSDGGTARLQGGVHSRAAEVARCGR
jgi:hypothetical protein